MDCYLCFDEAILMYSAIFSEVICKRDVVAAMEAGDKIVDIDDNLEDPQLCATIACDIYKHLRASEVIDSRLLCFR